MRSNPHRCESAVNSGKSAVRMNFYIPQFISQYPSFKSRENNNTRTHRGTSPEIHRKNELNPLIYFSGIVASPPYAAQTVDANEEEREEKQCIKTLTRERERGIRLETEQEKYAKFILLPRFSLAKMRAGGFPRNMSCTEPPQPLSSWRHNSNSSSERWSWIRISSWSWS